MKLVIYCKELDLQVTCECDDAVELLDFGSEVLQILKDKIRSVRNQVQTWLWDRK